MWSTQQVGPETLQAQGLVQFNGASSLSQRPALSLPPALPHDSPFRGRPGLLLLLPPPKVRSPPAVWAFLATSFDTYPACVPFSLSPLPAIHVLLDVII